MRQGVVRRRVSAPYLALSTLRACSRFPTWGMLFAVVARSLTRHITAAIFCDRFDIAGSAIALRFTGFRGFIRLRGTQGPGARHEATCSAWAQASRAYGSVAAAGCGFQLPRPRATARRRHLRRDRASWSETCQDRTLSLASEHDLRGSGRRDGDRGAGARLDGARDGVQYRLQGLGAVARCLGAVVPPAGAG